MYCTLVTADIFSRQNTGAIAMVRALQENDISSTKMRLHGG
jgi:hypothetical protein